MESVVLSGLFKAFLVMNALAVIAIFMAFWGTDENRAITFRSGTYIVLALLIYVGSEVLIGFIVFLTNYSESGRRGFTWWEVLELGTIFLPSFIAFALAWKKYNKKSRPTRKRASDFGVGRHTDQSGGKE